MIETLMDYDAEAVLGQAAVRRLRTLLEQRADAIVAIGTPSGVALWASEPGSKELFGRELADFERDNRFDYVHPEDVSPVKAVTPLRSSDASGPTSDAARAGRQRRSHDHPGASRGVDIGPESG